MAHLKRGTSGHLKKKSNGHLSKGCLATCDCAHAPSTILVSGMGTSSWGVVGGEACSPAIDSVVKTTDSFCSYPDTSSVYCIGGCRGRISNVSWIGGVWTILITLFSNSGLLLVAAQIKYTYTSTQCNPTGTYTSPTVTLGTIASPPSTLTVS